MSRLFDYLQFGITSSVLFFNKSQRPNYRAIFILSMCMFFNIMILMKHFYPLRGNYLLGFAIWGLVFFILTKFLYSVNRHRRVLRSNYDRGLRTKIVWNIIVIGYIVASLLTLPTALSQA